MYSLRDKRENRLLSKHTSSHEKVIVHVSVVYNYVCELFSGARFAQLMVVAGLAAVLSAYKVEPCARTSPTIEYDPRSVLVKNKGSIFLKFTPL